MGTKNRKKAGASTSEASGAALKLPRVPGPYAGLVRWIGLALAIFLLLGLLYPEAVWQGHVFLSSDTQNANAFATVGDRSLDAGDYPHWNPYLFAGMPSFGSLAYAKFLYPPSVVLNFLQDSLHSAPLTWLLAHLLFGGLGMAWLLSRWRLPTAALLLGVVIWLAAPKVVAWGVHGHGSKLGAAMYLPWIVGWVWRVLDGRGARAIGMTALLLGLQLLRGHVQITYYTLLVVGWLALMHAVWPLDEAARALAARVRWLRVGQVVAGLALGFVIGAILLVPVHEYAKISIRGQDTAGGGGVGLEYATGWSLAPAELPSLVFPAAAGFGGATYLGAMPFNDYPNYVGLLSLLLAVLAWWRGGRRLTIALLVMSLLALLVAFGRHGPGLYQLLYEFLPYFNKFRIPSMILIVVVFACAILAPRGAAAWAEGAEPGGRPRLWPLLVMGLGAVCLVGGATHLARGPFEASLAAMAQAGGREIAAPLVDEAWALHRASLVRIGLILLVAGSAFLASLKNESLRRGHLAWVLVVLVGMDLYGVDRLIVHPESGLLQLGREPSGRTRLVAAAPLTGPWRPARTAGASADTETLLRLTGHGRVYPLGAEAGRNSWMADGVRSLGGYHPAKLAAYEQIRRRLFSGQPAARLANWLGASVVAVDRPLEPQDLQALAFFGLELEDGMQPAGGSYVYRNVAALPRARLVTSWLPATELPEKDALEPFLDGIQDGSIPFADRVVLHETPNPAPQSHAGPLNQPVFRVDGLDEVVLEVDSAVPALLLLADMFAPGWKVTVDGEPKPLLRADFVLRAVALEAGVHEVRFEYFDPTVRTGLAATLAGTFLALGLVLFPVLRRDRTRPGAARADTPDSEEAASDA